MTVRLPYSALFSFDSVLCDRAPRAITTTKPRKWAMGILPAFAPFIVFALADRMVGPMEGLIAGALVAAALAARDCIIPGRAAKILEICTLLLFGDLALYAALGGPIGSVIGVRLCVVAGLLLIVLVSMAVGRPFTLQYARDQVASDLWGNPEFVRTNYIITAVWTLAFTLMVIAELALPYMPSLPRRVGIVAVILALIGAMKFTE
jgi:hypothetical protein